MHEVTAEAFWVSQHKVFEVFEVFELFEVFEVFEVFELGWLV
jgi:hypothetical protein